MFNLRHPSIDFRSDFTSSASDGCNHGLRVIREMADSSNGTGSDCFSSFFRKVKEVQKLKRCQALLIC